AVPSVFVFAAIFGPFLMRVARAALAVGFSADLLATSLCKRTGATSFLSFPAIASASAPPAGAKAAAEPGRLLGASPALAAAAGFAAKAASVPGGSIALAESAEGPTK